jgi:hypothetical protein
VRAVLSLHSPVLYILQKMHLLCACRSCIHRDGVVPTLEGGGGELSAMHRLRTGVANSLRGLLPANGAVLLNFVVRACLSVQFGPLGDAGFACWRASAPATPKVCMHQRCFIMISKPG